METIELKDVMNQLPVADLVKNLAGVDTNGVPSRFTMENIAAVVGRLSRFATGYFDLQKESMPNMPNDYIDIAKAVVSLVKYKDDVSFSYLIKFGAIFHVTGILYSGKAYGYFRMETVNSRHKAVIYLAGGEYEYRN